MFDNDTLEIILSALVYATFATIVSQILGVLIMWWLGLKPKQLAHEIEDVQNVAVGAAFFIIALTASIFIGEQIEKIRRSSSNTIGLCTTLR